MQHFVISKENASAIVGGRPLSYCGASSLCTPPSITGEKAAGERHYSPPQGNSGGRGDLSCRARRWCSGIMQDSHSCDPGSIPGRRTHFLPLSPSTATIDYAGHVFSKPLTMWPNVKAEFIWILNLNFRWILMNSAATVDSAGGKGKGYAKEAVPAWPNG